MSTPRTAAAWSSGSLGRRTRGACSATTAWAGPRAGLLVVGTLAAALMLWQLPRNGYANTYYASAVYAQSHSWSAFFFNALDLSGYVSVDKTPLSLWMMDLSTHVLGFSSFSLLLPDALCGLATVLVLYATVARSLGRRAAGGAGGRADARADAGGGGHEPLR